MKLMSKALAAIGLAAAALPAITGTAHAQAMSGRQLPDRPAMNISYYKTPPGKQDEWLALFIKWHHPIMEALIKRGVMTSSIIYANASHSVEPSWDFVVITTMPAPKDAKKDTMTRGELVKSLFPDLDAFYAGEKSRWALTVGHWDESPMEVDLGAKHPGVYYPIIPGEK